VSALLPQKIAPEIAGVDHLAATLFFAPHLLNAGFTFDFIALGHVVRATRFGLSRV